VRSHTSSIIFKSNTESKEFNWKKEKTNTRVSPREKKLTRVPFPSSTKIRGPVIKPNFTAQTLPRALVEKIYFKKIDYCLRKLRVNCV
jgi:hypothetical protein